MKRIAYALALTVSAQVASAAWGASWAAAQSDAADPVAERSTAFEAVEGAQDERVSGLGLMVASYALIWVFTLGFVARMARLEGRLADDVARLEKALPDQDA